MNVCVAVHGGAGAHHPSSGQEVKKALRLACSKSLDALLRGDAATGAVEDAISVLEDEPCLNAGHGSNLTLDGKVECDAAIMDGRTGDFGSVGAVSGVKNPIKLAHVILRQSRRPDPIGRIPPMTLVSEGAHAFAISHDVGTVPPEVLVTSRATKEWSEWVKRLRSSDSEQLGGLQDTVGAISRDAQGGLAAGVSSGGLLLKTPGRVGEAAVFGAGCWAEQWSENGLGRGLACSVSGAGEYITRTMLARTIGEKLRGSAEQDTHEILQTILVNDYWKPLRDRGLAEADVGILLLTVEDNGDGSSAARLWCAFTTESMAIAYASPTQSTPKAVIARRSGSAHSAKGDGPPIYITAFHL